MAARSKLLCLLALLAVCAVPAKPALAHSLAIDGRISAFLHIAPDDKPVPGKVNTVHFYFNDQDFRFSMEGCDCSAKVTEGKKVLYKGTLAAEANRTGKINVLLPDNNFSYNVAVNGTPKTAGFFQPFRLKFDIDVGNPPPTPPPDSHWKEYLIAGVIGLAAVAVISYRLLHNRVTIIK